MAFSLYGIAWITGLYSLRLLGFDILDVNSNQHPIKFFYHRKVPTDTLPLNCLSFMQWFDDSDDDVKDGCYRALELLQQAYGNKVLLFLLMFSHLLYHSVSEIYI